MRVMGIGVGRILLQWTVRSSTYILYQYAVQKSEVCSGFYYDKPLLYAADQFGQCCSAMRVCPEIAWRVFQKTHGCAKYVCVRTRFRCAIALQGLGLEKRRKRLWAHTSEDSILLAV